MNTQSTKTATDQIAVQSRRIRHINEVTLGQVFDRVKLCDIGYWKHYAVFVFVIVIVIVYQQ
jgi:hypothetical protein